MNKSVTIAPPNSLVVVTESATTADIPKEMKRGAGIASTRSCIVVGCLMFQDGDTKITLGPSPVVPADCRLAFAGFLDTPHHRIALWTIEWQKLLEAGVPTTRTKIQIWTNHVTDPDEVYIKVGE